MAKVTGLSAQELYKLISSHSFMPDCLQVLRLSYLRSDISTLHAQVLLLEEVLLSRNELPLTKYQALLAVQQLLQTASYPGLLFIQIYLSPLLADMALYFTRKRSDEQLECYFIERGYKESIGIRKLSHKVVQKASALVLLAAAIKPYQNVLHTQINVPSRFELLAAALRQAGGVVDDELNAKEMQTLRVTYLKEIKGLNAVAFGAFVSKKLKQEIFFKQNISISTRKLMDSQDAALSIPAINLCVSMLSDVPRHFQQQKAYLALFNSFIKQGNVYAIIVAHNAPFISEIFKEVAKVKGDQGLTVGRFIYPEAQASIQDKLNFYSEFLKCLEIWAVCLPQNEIGEESEVLKYYTYLKEERQFVFPEMLLLRRAQQEFNQCLEEKQIQNEEILRIIETDDKLMAEYAKVKSSVIQLSLKMEQIVKQPRYNLNLSYFKSNQIIEKKNQAISEVKSDGSSQEIRQKLESLIKEGIFRIQGLVNQSKVIENMQALKSFNKEWPNIRQNYQGILNSSIIQKGDSLKQKINEIYPFYLRLKKKLLSFNSFRNKVVMILGLQIKSSGFNNFDDYALEKLSSKNENSVCNRTIIEASKQQSFITLRCESNLKNAQIGKEIQKNKQALNPPQINPPLTPIITSEISNALNTKKVEKLHQQNAGNNEYGIRQLLIKHKQFLNASKQSISSKKSKKSSDIPAQVNNRIISSSIINLNHQSSNQSSEISQRSDQPQAQTFLQKQQQISPANCSATSKRMSFSQPSENSTDELNEVEERSQNNKMNVFEIYQIKIEGREPFRNANIQKREQGLSEGKATNYTNSIRSRLYLQKICNSSTRKSIEEYSRKVNSANSLKNTQYSGSRAVSKSIIQRQYKRIALQQHRQYQSLRKLERQESSSESNINASFVSNKSKRETINAKAELTLQKYSSIFINDKSSKMMKNCLKTKGLLFGNDDIQIGFVHFRRDSTLSIILYLTTSKNANLIRFQIVSPPQILIHSDQSTQRQLRKNKQEIIKLDASIKAAPFQIPSIKMTLKVGYETKTIQFTLPCTFNKFVATKYIDSDMYSHAIKTSQTSLIQTPRFKISNSQTFQTKISKFFSISPPVRLTTKGLVCTCECTHLSKSFMIKILYQDKTTGVIVGSSPTKHIEELQFLLATLGFALAIY